ncbi:hypothetical protein Tco_0379157 [Tanacetum coccineum]
MTRKKFHELAQHLQEVMEESLHKMVDSSVRNYMSGHVSHVNPAQASPASTQEQQYQLYLTMKDNPQLQQDDLLICLTLTYKFERLYVSDTSYRPSAVHLRYQDDPNDDAYPEGENSAKRQKTFEHGTYMFVESSSGQDNESEQSLSTSGNQEQLDDFDFWTDSYGTDDDELPTEKVSQELVEEMSQTVDEAKLHKVVNEMLRQRCTSGDEHQYHINHICLKLPKRSQSFFTISCQTDLLYLKKGNSRHEKIVMSLHKFPAVIFLDNDIEERTSKWVDKCVKKFNPYARNSVEHCVEIYQQKVNLTAPTITLLGIEKYMVFSIVYEPVYGIIYKNNKKEKRAMRHQEVHKLCDATLKRVLEGLKSYNNNVKHGYVTLSLSKEDAEFLQLFEEEIEELLKYHDQMRR